MTALSYSRRLRLKRLALVGVIGTLSTSGALLAIHGRDLLRLSGPSERFARLEQHLASDVERGIALFAFGDFGALTSDTLQVSASPWKIVIAALALNQANGDLTRLAEFDLAATFRAFGFHSPERIENWPDHLPTPDLSTPLGQNLGLASHPILPLGITLGNMGCAACHSGVIYDEKGRPDPSRVWLGASNSSINLQAYTEATFQALRDQGAEPNRLIEAVERLFPDTSAAEALLLRYAILPVVLRQIAERNALFGGLLPFHAGVPGATNGLDSLRARLGLLQDRERVPESVFNSVPDLGDRLFRTMLLNTGSYMLPGVAPNQEVLASDIDEERRRALAGIIAFFTVPAFGLDPEAAEARIDEVEAVTAWLQDYRPQPFPGPIDRGRLADGRDLYASLCASCHGDYGPDPERPEMVSFPNWEGDLGTDALRRTLVAQDLVDAVNGSTFGTYIAARTVEGYSAPPLTGLWSSGPYLHNGAVPTIWHLMHPEARPESFAVGGHSVDFERLGIAIGSDPSFEPWARSVVIDTTAPGFGAGGHERPFAEMSEDEKTALLEYLKLL
jgi:hypothetical protein